MNTLTDSPASDDGVGSLSWAVQFPDGEIRVHGAGPPAFTFCVSSGEALERVVQADIFTAATAFMRGEFDIRGDLGAAIRLFYQERSSGRHRQSLARSLVMGLIRIRDFWLQRRERAADNIQFHYDRSNDFYRQFLGSGMLYSCAYYKNAGMSLEEAQTAKLDHICRKLDLRPNEKFLDIGCGWGSLTRYAAEHYAVRAEGCTISPQQFEYAREQVARDGLVDRVSVRLEDFRTLRGRWDKIAVVGMQEHLGEARIQGYYDTVYDLLEDGGLMMNHGLIRPPGIRPDAETLFWHRHVFPGAEPPRLRSVIGHAEDAGFEVVDVENLRSHYVLTCRAWLERLEHNRAACLKAVDPEIWRAWRLFLAGAMVKLEDAQLELHQILLAKRSSPRGRRMTREYMYP